MSEENNSVASNEVASEIQHEAESQGWVPKERFRGNESDWVDALEGILSGITGVGSYTVNPSTNTVEVKSDCDGNENTLSDSEFIMGLSINYNIKCES